MVAPNGRFIPFDESIFEPPEEEMEIREALFSGRLKQTQIDKYVVYRKSHHRQPNRKIVRVTGSPISIPSDIPKKLSHTLEMKYEVRKNGHR